jgi:hypothetical protein
MTDPGADDEEAGAAIRRGYDKEIIDRVWHFGKIISGNDPELWRKDEFDAWIHRLDYGNRHSQFGWEIAGSSLGRAAEDHGIAALRPLHWQNYLDESTAHHESRITADGLHNIRQLL